MAHNRFSRGDRVRLDPAKADEWAHLFRKFAQTGREATVLHVPGDRMGSRRYVIQFDVKQNARRQTLEVAEADIIPAGKS